MVSILLADGRRVEVVSVAEDALRIRLAPGRARASGLVRYGVVAESLPGAPDPIVRCLDNCTQVELPRASIVVYADGRMDFRDTHGETLLVVREVRTPVSGGYFLSCSIDPLERVQGLGDVARDRLCKRGYATPMWVRNVSSYVPVPFLMGERGWGLFIDTTWRHVVDVASERSDLLSVRANGGAMDIVLFAGGSYRSNLDRFTALTGRPALLPMWAYGLTFVCNQQADARELVDDALNFRREGIPCDLIGLEPGWMSKYYDNTTKKTWHPERFYIPEWLGKRSPASFVGALDRLGFKLSLWLCCDYDLFWESERRLGDKRKEDVDIPVPHPDDFERDQHFGHPPRRMDDVTVIDEPWFSHLRQFVDQGVRAFKLDGAYQVNEHPDRLYGNGMGDEEAHNLYPVIYNQQMAEGYAAYTGKRPMIYTAGGYTGIQAYSATWAGDTGGGCKPLCSMLNHAFVGHANVSCDMDVFSVSGIHFGFLQAWSQVNSWAYWRHPWLLGEKLKPIFVSYAVLRYRLLPYLYSMAHGAACSGWPIMRPMELVHPDDANCRDLINQYYLGDDLLVGCFTDRIYLPAGNWYDWWTGRHVSGGEYRLLAVPEDRGGPLYVRGGAVIPCAPPMDWIGQKKDGVLILEVFPGGDGKTVVYEDDGESLEWRRGDLSTTSIVHSSGRLEIGPRMGSFSGSPPERTIVIRFHWAQKPILRIDGEVAVPSIADGGWEVVVADPIGRAHPIVIEVED